MRFFACLLALGLVVACTNEGSADTSSETETESGNDDVGSSESSSETTAADTSTDTDGVPDCTPGAWGCICGEGGSCAPDLVCTDGKCTFSDCNAGFDGCPCEEGGLCNDGLFCIEGTCGCQPGALACGCIDGACDGDLSCIADECWLMSPYPNCGWIAANEYYYCGSILAHPDYPIECPADLVVGMPCPPELTFIGCCTATDTWWCQDGVIATMAC